MRRSGLVMQFYEDVIRQHTFTDRDLPLGAHFHAWTPETIARVWTIWASNPVLRGQFYPAHYYEALLAEAAAYLGGAATIADIGCGSGTVLSAVSSLDGSG